MWAFFPNPHGPARFYPHPYRANKPRDETIAFGRMSFSLLTDDALCEVAKGNMPLLLALQATCKDARRVLSSWLKMQVSVRLQVRLQVPDAHHGPVPVS